MNHHFRSYSEQLQQTQQQQQQQQPPLLVSNQSPNTSLNSNQLQADQQQATNQGSIIRIHSDSQQSLDRLFNPANTQTTVPLRNRNLPASFFNPSWQTTSTSNNAANDNNDTSETKPALYSNGSTDNLNRTTTTTTNGFNTHQGFHNRSVSLFVPRGSGMTTPTNNTNNSNNNLNNNNNTNNLQQQPPQPPNQGLVMPQHTNVHMRTRSTLAPMTGAVVQRTIISGTINQQQFVNTNTNINNTSPANTTTNNNNYNHNINQQQQNLHSRSISMFEQRPRENTVQQQAVVTAVPQRMNLHMRSGSGLAPMTNPEIQSPNGSNQFLNNNHQTIAQQQQQMHPPPLSQQQHQQFSYYPPSNQEANTDVVFSGTGSGASTTMDQCYMQQEPVSPSYLANNDPLQQQFHITHSQPYIPYNPSLSTSSGSLNPTTASSTSSSSNENNSLLDIANGGRGASSTIVQTDSKSWYQSGIQQDIYFEYQ